jgi:galactose mutarotase-like enzyme
MLRVRQMRARPSRTGETSMQPSQASHSIGDAMLSATIKPDGAELISLRGAGEGELLWQAGPQWPRHSPVLFPIVGRLAEGRLRHQGRDYVMTQHGFARDSLFDWVERSEARAVLRLTENAQTQAVYPFRFILELTYAIAEGALSVTTRVTNPGDVVLPCSVGAHPAFNWPLMPGIPKERHVLEFEAPEEASAVLLTDGLLDARTPLPWQGRSLPLSPELFAKDALILPSLASRSVRFIARDEAGRTARAIKVSWEGYRDLGIWSKPDGAPFLCIEPWFGMASPMGWDGEFTEKPGTLLLAPGESRAMSWSVKVEA